MPCSHQACCLPPVPSTSCRHQQPHKSKKICRHSFALFPREHIQHLAFPHSKASAKNTIFIQVLFIQVLFSPLTRQSGVQPVPSKACLLFFRCGGFNSFLSVCPDGDQRITDRWGFMAKHHLRAFPTSRRLSRSPLRLYS